MRRRRVEVRALAAIALGLLLVLACAPRRAPERWQAVEVPTDATFSGMWFSDSLNGWVTGGGWSIEGGIVGRTRDGGRTWQFQSGASGGGTGGLGRVEFRDSLFGCATAEQSILLTDDGGASWRPARGAGYGGRLNDVQFLDNWNGFAAGTSVVRTEDGGETWLTMIRGASENGYLSANAIHFMDASRGWLVSHSGQLQRTDDGGRNWKPVALPLREGERPTFWDITFVDANHGWVVGERGSIFHTADGGWTWALQDSGVPIVRVIPKGEPRRPREVVPELETEPDRLTLSAIQFVDANEGWTVGYYADVAESVVLHTADGGETWEVERVQPGELLRALFVQDAEHAWATGDRARTQPQVILRYVGAAPAR